MESLIKLRSNEFYNQNLVVYFKNNFYKFEIQNLFSFRVFENNFLNFKFVFYYFLVNFLNILISIFYFVDLFNLNTLKNYKIQSNAIKFTLKILKIIFTILK